MQLGWSPLDIEPACCVANTMAELEAEACGKAAKRRRGNMPLVATTIVDLAGNAQALPDLAFFAIPLLYAINRPDLFAHIVKANDLESFGVHSASDLVVGLDPDMAQVALKDFFKSALPPLEVGEDLDSGGDSGRCCPHGCADAGRVDWQNPADMTLPFRVMSSWITFCFL